jgi:hypothetical protein
VRVATDADVAKVRLITHRSLRIIKVLDCLASVDTDSFEQMCDSNGLSDDERKEAAAMWHALMISILT